MFLRLAVVSRQSFPIFWLVAHPNTETLLGIKYARIIRYNRGMYAGEEKLKLGLDRFHKAGDDVDLLGAALISLHGALEDRFRHALASTPELPASEQKRVLDVAKVQWNELIEMMRLYRGLSAEDAAQIQKMNRERQAVAHGNRYKAGQAALERYAQLVRGFFPGLELASPAPRVAPRSPAEAERTAPKPKPEQAAKAQTTTQPASRPRPKAAAKPAEKSTAEPGPARKQTASPAKAQAPLHKPRRINPALVLILGLLFIIACVGLSTLIQGNADRVHTTPANTEAIPSLPSISTSAYRVTTDILNMRTEPGMTATIITTLANGTRVEVLNEETRLDGRIWTRVRTGSYEGWVDSQYLREE